MGFGWSKVWEQAEFESLILNIVVSGKTKPPPGRSRSECEQELENFLHFLATRIHAAVPSYYAKNPDIPGGLERVREVLTDPTDGDEVHYYGILKETLEFGEKDLYEGIHKTVEEFYQTIDISRER